MYLPYHLQALHEVVCRLLQIVQSSPFLCLHVCDWLPFPWVPVQTFWFPFQFPVHQEAVYVPGAGKQSFYPVPVVQC